jgi:hypothetical protein
MSGIIYTPPTAAAVIPDLDQVMNVGNFTTVAYIGNGIVLGTRTVTGPATYNVTDTDFLILCDIGAGNVNINVDGAYQNIYAIKLVNWQLGNIARVNIIGGGTIDGALSYPLTRAHGSVIIASKQNGLDFAVIANNDGLGSVNSGVYVDAAFTGNTITMPHTLNTLPTGVTIEPGNSLTGQILLSGYFINKTTTDIIITLGTTIVIPSGIQIFWTVSRN